MGTRLRTFVHVHDSSGASHVFGPHDDIPAWAVERITNPKVWADAEAEDVAPPPAPADPPVGGAELSEPPRAGQGSGREAWAEYAAALGLEVADGDTRNDIIAAVDAAGRQ